MHGVCVMSCRDQACLKMLVELEWLHEHEVKVQHVPRSTGLVVPTCTVIRSLLDRGVSAYDLQIWARTPFKVYVYTLLHSVT